ncbi:MAG: hypothetical protein WDW36_009566 [Sanguina aurantia]
MVAVLIVSTSHSILGETGEATGSWAEEVASPYYLFKAAGYTVDITSIAGGEIPFDEPSLAPPYLTKDVERFLLDDDAMAQVFESRVFSSVSADAYDAVYLPGGHGTCWDFPGNATLKQLVETFWKSGKVVSAVCHGVIGLLEANDESGACILAGKQATGFSNTEEFAVVKEKIVPFLLEDAMKAKGAIYTAAGNWKVHALRDGKLVTGQNPQSSARVAELVIEALQSP